MAILMHDVIPLSMLDFKKYFFLIIRRWDNQNTFVGLWITWQIIKFFLNCFDVGRI